MKLARLIYLTVLGVLGLLLPAEAGKPSGNPPAKGRDTTPPTITCPADITAEATSPSGAQVWFWPYATDDKDPAPVVSCSPAPGGWFSIGTTLVTATATDWKGNTATCSFNVTVQDTTPPTISCPPDIYRNWTSPDGAVVTFAASVWDAVDDSPTITYSPASGSTFPDGTTTVTVTAADDAGNSSTYSFDVTYDGDPTDGPFAGTYAFTWYYTYAGFFYDWSVTISADGTVSGSGHQTAAPALASVYDEYGYPYGYVFEGLTNLGGLEAFGSFDGHVTDAGSLEASFTYDLWVFADGWPSMESGGFPIAGQVSLEPDGNLVVTGLPEGVQALWFKQ